ncbi:hypothetical protein [Streptomyces sp. NPDC002851]
MRESLITTNGPQDTAAGASASPEAAAAGASPHDAAAEPAVRLVGAMHLFGRTSPPVLLFHGKGGLPELLAHLAGELDAWRQQGTVPEAPPVGPETTAATRPTRDSGPRPTGPA